MREDGPQTVAAVEQLQRDAGLPVTGLPDPNTERALADAVQEATDVALAAAATHNAATQGALKVFGYWTGPIDGRWSDALANAVKRLQSDLGLEPTGTFDAATLHAIEQQIAETRAAASAATSTTTPPEKPVEGSPASEPEGSPEETPEEPVAGGSSTPTGRSTSMSTVSDRRSESCSPVIRYWGRERAECA